MSNLTNALATITDRLVLLASEDATLRQELRSLATELLTALEQMDESPPEQVETAAVSINPTQEADLVATAPAPVKPEPEPAIESLVPLPVLRLGQSTPLVESPPPKAGFDFHELDLPKLEWRV